MPRFLWLQYPYSDREDAQQMQQIGDIWIVRRVWYQRDLACTNNCYKPTIATNQTPLAFVITFFGSLQRSGSSSMAHPDDIPSAYPSMWNARLQ